MPNGEVTEFDPITAIAIASFDATSADLSFDRSLAGLDRARHDEIYSAAWDLICAYQDAAYAFGAAVGLQLNGWSAPGNGDEESSDESRR